MRFHLDQKRRCSCCCSFSEFFDKLVFTKNIPVFVFCLNVFCKARFVSKLFDIVKTNKVVSRISAQPRLNFCTAAFGIEGLWHHCDSAIS